MKKQISALFVTLALSNTALAFEWGMRSTMGLNIGAKLQMSVQWVKTKALST
ncbi:hypothetical protein [Vibrio navarrensis]|uniref:hypothetical protein n=1 Tax=Vibrio navarrensis TaxID=29495 RepID=UPI002095BBB0|nr:hypothetical protein [Vibrio navarrensis]